MTTTTTDPQSVVDDFNAIHGSVTWVRYWTGTRDDAPKYDLTDGKAWLLGGHTPVVRVRGESSCIALTHVDVLPGQPDDIDDDSHYLPDLAGAAERVGEYIAANGDGIYDVLDGHPMYARDLEAIRRAAGAVWAAEQLRAEREHMELNPTGTAEWLKNRVNELTAELDRVRADLRDVLAELKDRTADARGARSDYEELKGVNADTARERDEARAEMDRVRADLATAHNHAHRQDTNLQQIARAKDEIAAERDALKAKLADAPPAWATFTADDMHGAGLETVAAEMERDAARAELDRLRMQVYAQKPVIEAAEAWAEMCEDGGIAPDDCRKSEDALFGAVESYRVMDLALTSGRAEGEVAR